MSYQPIKSILSEAEPGTEITVKGWVRTKRESKNAIFVALKFEESVVH